MNKEKIKAHFGKDFYKKLLNDLDKYAKLWGLSDFTQIDYYSINAIFECNSIKHGECVLKIGGATPDFVKETENEYNILCEYSVNKLCRFCKVWEADTVNGVLLLERIKPGTRLRDEPNLEKRLTLFCEISRGLHVKPSDKSLYPTYKGWVIRITEFMRQFANGKYHELLQKIIKAEKVCLDLCEKYTGEMLLHGDLHHDNILLGNDGYRVIDPKGVIGDPVFDIPRFILNEFPEPPNEIDVAFDNKYHKISTVLAEKFNIPEYDINRLVYVETCMANCWNVESGLEPDMSQIKFTEIKL